MASVLQKFNFRLHIIIAEHFEAIFLRHQRQLDIIRRQFLLHYLLENGEGVFGRLLN